MKHIHGMDFRIKEIHKLNRIERHIKEHEKKREKSTWEKIYEFFTHIH